MSIAPAHETKCRCDEPRISVDRTGWAICERCGYPDDPRRYTSQDRSSIMPPPMTETEAVAKAIYEGRNGRGCVPWARLPAAHKGPYLADAMAAIRVILERQCPRQAW